MDKKLSIQFEVIALVSLLAAINDLFIIFNPFYNEFPFTLPIVILSIQFIAALLFNLIILIGFIQLSKRYDVKYLNYIALFIFLNSLLLALLPYVQLGMGTESVFLSQVLNLGIILGGIFAILFGILLLKLVSKFKLIVPIALLNILAGLNVFTSYAFINSYLSPIFNVLNAILFYLIYKDTNTK